MFWGYVPWSNKGGRFRERRMEQIYRNRQKRETTSPGEKAEHRERELGR